MVERQPLGLLQLEFLTLYISLNRKEDEAHYIVAVVKGEFAVGILVAVVVTIQPHFQAIHVVSICAFSFPCLSVHIWCKDKGSKQ